MSVNITIKEGGIDRSQNQTNKLKINTLGGGVCYWRPETETQTDSKRITQNGTYTAEDEGLYGYDEIDVSIPKTGNMSGKRADGNDYSITVDDNGYIVETKIPSSIRITTPPPKVSYEDGETIDYAGMVVKLYDGEGNLFTDTRYHDGIIPLNELVLTEHTAHYDGSGGGEEGLDYSGIRQYLTYPNSYPSPMPLFDIAKIVTTNPTGSSSVFPLETKRTTTVKMTAFAYNGDPKNIWIVAADKNNFTVQRDDKYANGTETTGTESPTYSQGIGEGIYKYAQTGINANAIDYSVSGYWMQSEYFSPMGNTDTEDVYKILAYGEMTGGGSIQTISVQWISPYNADTYSDTFDITVHETSTESGTAHGNEGGFEGGGSEHGF